MNSLIHFHGAQLKYKQKSRVKVTNCIEVSNIPVVAPPATLAGAAYSPFERLCLSDVAFFSLQNIKPQILLLNSFGGMCQKVS